MIETVPLLVIFIVLLGFGLGFFSVIQTAIMNSMAARTYAFETFRNRADLTIFRDTSVSGSQNIYQYSKWGSRFHTVNDERIPASVTNGTYATKRPILFDSFRSFSPPPTSGSSSSGGLENLHNNKIYETALQDRYKSKGVSPAWVMVGYGICLNANCGNL